MAALVARVGRLQMTIRAAASFTAEHAFGLRPTGFGIDASVISCRASSERTPWSIAASSLKGNVGRHSVFLLFDRSWSMIVGLARSPSHLDNEGHEDRTKAESRSYRGVRGVGSGAGSMPWKSSDL